MKKNGKLIASVLFIILFIGVIVYFGGKNNKESNLPQSGDLVVVDTYETKALPTDDVYTKFDVKYPSFKNAPADFNSEIENLIKAEVEDFKKNSAENWQARYDTQSVAENIPKVPAGDSDKFTFSSSFNIMQSNDSYISFILRYGGFNGGAHGFLNIVSYNYDLKNKKVLALSDLFPSQKDYLNYLSTESRIYLKNKFAILSEEDKKNSDPQATLEYVDNMTSMIEAGTEPKLQNFNTFTFTNDMVKIYFADYQVGPHSIGMPEFEVKRG